MIFVAFLCGGLASAIIIGFLARILGGNNTIALIWVSTSFIIASLCGCSAWIVETLKNK